MKFFLLGVVILAIIGLATVRFLSIRRSTLASASEEQIPGTATGRKITDVIAISIALSVDTEPSLFILLAANGTINRMGTGTLDCQDKELFIGRIEPAVFENVRLQLTETMLQHPGTYSMPQMRGAHCELTVVLQFKDGTSGGCRFLYGSESIGPPKEVGDLLRTAVAQTDDWHEQFKCKSRR